MFMNPVHCLPACFCTCALFPVFSATLHAETAYSTPCGYIQTDLYAKQTNYLGLGVHPEALMQHTLKTDNVTSSGSKVTITDPDVNFNELMDENSAYILALHFGNEVVALPLNRDGWKKPSSCWKEHEIEVSDSLLAEFLKKGNSPDFYVLRKARTLNDVLGDDNKFGLKSGSAASADNASIFNSETTKQAVYYSGTQWMRRGSKEDVGGMPVFGHEPLDITRKAGEDIKAFVIGEVSPKHQKLLLAGHNSLLHTRLPLAHSLRETGLQNTLQSGDAVYVPLGDKNVMVKCTYQRDHWENEKGQDVSDIPFHGILSISSTSKTPAYININSSISTQQ